jgi:uncharacterized protein YjcR
MKFVDFYLKNSIFMTLFYVLKLDIMSNVIENYKKIKNSIPELIEISGYRNDYIAKQLGIKPSNFSAKKQRGNWNEDELTAILNTLRKPSIELEDFLEDILESVFIEENVKGEMMTSEEFEKRMKW